jgi:peptidoglycan-N-acetylmuramic acid deacetylase
MSKRIKAIIVIVIAMVIISISIISAQLTRTENTIQTASSALSNTKICWGVKRETDHKQPDLGSKNKEIIEQYNGIAMGNSEKKYVYLTFDEGYEAGYTNQILQVLKDNDVKAAFFLTGHFINTQEEIVKQMIEDGNIIRQSYS